MMRSLSTRLLLWTNRSKPNLAPLKSFKSLIFLSFLLLFIFLINLTACKKDPYTLGLSLLPPTDTLSVSTNDTASIVAYSVLQDSIRSDETTTNILGSLVDPVFGVTTSSFCTQLRLSTEGVDFGINPVLDSVVLMLRYSSIYGNPNSLQRVKVFELNENISVDSAYYSNHKITYYNTLLADYTFKPNLKDSISIYRTKVLPHLRINLNKHTNYFGNKILYAPSDALLNNNNFIKFINGLYIESSPVSANGSLISFDMNTGLTGMVVFFHNQDATGNVKDSLNYSLVIDQLCARINTFDHNHYTDAVPEFKNQVLNHDTNQGKNILFLQGLAGVKIKVRLPFLKDFGKSQKIAINNAILVLKNQETDTTLAPPANLTLVQVDSLGKMSFLIDYNEGSSYFGGTYNISDRSYHFRITRHIQQIIGGKTKNNDLYLMVNDPSSKVLMTKRMMGIGTRPQFPAINSDRLQLQIIYTKVH
jgi:Domain of unknown function (DUF4270)